MTSFGKQFFSSPSNKPVHPTTRSFIPESAPAPAIATALPTAAAAILPARSGTVARHCALPLGAATLAAGCLFFGALFGGHAGLSFGAIGLAFLLGHGGGIHCGSVIRKTRTRDGNAENQRGVVKKVSGVHHGLLSVKLYCRYQVAFLMWP